MPTFRKNTLDDKIWNRIHNNIEYKIPNKFKPTDIVIDIGAHIGGFSHTALQRGACIVYAYEAHPENYHLLEKNLEEFSNAYTFNQAVTRSDGAAPEFLYIQQAFPRFNLNKAITNTGGLGARPVPSTSKHFSVPTIAFDSIISEIDNRIRMVKFDCEGAEFPIILTSNKLEMIDEIVGEYHLGGIYTDIPHKLHLLQKKLQDAGFQFSSESAKGSKALGKFHAWR